MPMLVAGAGQRKPHGIWGLFFHACNLLTAYAGVWCSIIGETTRKRQEAAEHESGKDSMHPPPQLSYTGHPEAVAEDSTKVNTSLIERLNLTMPQCCAYLGRRRLSHTRRQHRLASHLELVRCFDNCIRPHSALKFGKIIRTPAMQASLVSRWLRFRDIFQAASGPAPNRINNTT